MGERTVTSEEDMDWTNFDMDAFAFFECTDSFSLVPVCTSHRALTSPVINTEKGKRLYKKLTAKRRLNFFDIKL